MGWFDKIKKKENNTEVEILKTKISELEEKLKESQKNIDKTNAFWKKKYYHLKNFK
jgi:transposase-like protein